MEETYQELVHTLRNLPLGASDGNFVTGLLSARKTDLAVPFLLKRLQVRQPHNQTTVIQAVDVDDLGRELGVHSIDHLQNFRLDEFKVLGVTGRRAAYHIVNAHVIIFSANAA